MLVADVFKVYLYPDPLTGSGIPPYDLEEGEDITSGIINVNIVQGTDLYEGPQEQIDSGQFTIVTRNPAMDPKINPNLKYNSRIKFYDERSGEFFRGYVTDIQVQYQRNDDPIITITGTDIFGAMQRVVIDQEIHDFIMGLSTGPTWNGITFTEFIDYMGGFSGKYLDLGVDYIGPPGYPIPWGFWFESTQSFGSLTLGNLGYSPAKYIPQVGETYLEVINKYAQTNLTSFSAKSNFGDPYNFHYINVSNFPKYDPKYWLPQQDPLVEYTTYDFSSDPVDNKPYRSILLDNGYNRVINQVDISNEYRFVEDDELKSESENFTRISDQSFEDYAISRASISTIYPEDAPLSNATWANRYSENIFQVTAYPNQEIQQITFDNARLEDIENDFSYSSYNLNRIVRIKHQINETETIDRVYDIAGISHDISPDNWEMTFTLKPNAQEVVFNYQGALPTLEMNATSGDTNFEFTATLVDFDPSTVSQVIWALSARRGNEITDIWPYALSGNMFKDGLVRDGFTHTWNFDDDGILAPNSFDSEGTWQDPIDNRFGGYGSGNWEVYAFITLTNRFTVVLQQELTVGTPEVQANFGWAQNLTNNFAAVSFVDTSVNNEIGEPDSYAWDFGDGTTSSLENPAHLYDPDPDETEYEVSLTVFAYGEEEEKIYSTHTETVTLVQPVMVPNFTYTSAGADITFTNTSTNVGVEEPDAYFWDFGDGFTSTEKNPSHTYAAEDGEEYEFDVSLTTKNIWEQTETVTLPVNFIGNNQTGTMPVRYLQLRNGTTYGYKPSNLFGFNKFLTASLYNLKARTSITKANLSYLKPIISNTGTNAVFQSWNANSDTTTNSIYPTALTNQVTTSPGTFPVPTPAGFHVNRVNGALNADFKSTIDLGTPTNYIKDIVAFAKRRYQIAEQTRPFPGVNAEIEVWTTLETGTLNDPDTATWFKIGSFETGPTIPNANHSAGYVGQTQTMDAIRPLPLNIPYFYYTVNNQTVTFTSIETADSYAWDFGDGTTSTLKDPVKQYSAKGTYTVTLEVTNDDVVTRTTTEPVIIKSIIPFNVRYIKLEQNEHTGAHAWDTPTVLLFKPKRFEYTLPVGRRYNYSATSDLIRPLLPRYSSTDYDQMFHSAGYYQMQDSPSAFSIDDITSSGESVSGTVNGVEVSSPVNLHVSENVWNLIQGGIFDSIETPKIGFRARSLEESFTTSWSVVVDLVDMHNGIDDFILNLRCDAVRDVYAPGSPKPIRYPATSGVTYSVYVTDSSANSIDPDAVTWVKVGDIVPEDIPVSTIASVNQLANTAGATYNIIPE